MITRILSVFFISCLGSALLTACGGASSVSSQPSATPTPQVTALRKAVQGCFIENASWVSLGDNDRTLTLDGEGEEDTDGGSWEMFSCVMQALKITSAVTSHIKETRALDGMQTDSWDQYKARWTYHPDAGVDITFTTT